MWRYREVLSRITGEGSEGWVGRSVEGGPWAGGPGNRRFRGFYQEDGETLIMYLLDGDQGAGDRGLGVPRDGSPHPFPNRPPELADPIVLHEPSSRREAPPRVLDVVVSESPESRITAIGGKAWQNDREPGYAVFKFTGAEEVELPGEIYLERSGSKKPGEIVRSGTQVEIKAASS